MLLIGLALASPGAPRIAKAPAAGEAPRLLVMHADPAFPGGWWVERAGTGRPLDTLALAAILHNVTVPLELEAHRRRRTGGRLALGVVGGATFVSGMMVLGALPPPVFAGPEPLPGGYDDADAYHGAYTQWTEAQGRADKRDEVLTNAAVLLGASTLCWIAVPLVGSDHGLRIRHPGTMWTNEAAVEEIEAYNTKLRASVELSPVGARLTVELP